MSYIEKFSSIEEFAKNFWAKKQVNIAKIDHNKEPEIVLDFFPYPSGLGLHIGHTLGYFATDVYARFKRLNGKNILFAMGYDAFGLPAEQFAIETGQRPEITTKKNISNMKKQLDNMGLMHDPTRIFSTTEPSYYKWTQWIFIKLYNSYFDQEQNKALPIKHLEEKLRNDGLNEEEIYQEINKERLAYLDNVEVNWCPKLGTVLSDEEVINGLSERGNHPVFKQRLPQWILRITKYSQRLLEYLDDLNWPESIKEMQKNWIGLSYGHEITFNEYTQPYTNIEIEPILVAKISQVKKCNDEKLSLTIFTTRLDTIAGATFCAISIKHPKIEQFLRTPEAHQFYAQNKNNDEFVGSVFTGVYMHNPINNRKIPLFIADYILGYGTGAVMGVPAHDERDYKLAKQHDLDIIPVIKFDEDFMQKNNILENDIKTGNIPCAYIKKDANLYLYNGRTIEQEIQELEKNDWIVPKTQTKLRDWIFSRQRYWGEPFPIIFDKSGKIYILEESALPIELPELNNFQATTDSQEITKPLDHLPKWRDVNFVKLDLYTARIVDGVEGEEINIDDKKYIIQSGKRETNTMPNWAGSCWYYLRYMDPWNQDEFVSMDAQEYWVGKNFHLENSEHNKNSINKETRNLGCVDLYLGGAEHAVLHLLYARFWHMVLYDLGYLMNKEPFNRLFNQGMVLGSAYCDEQGKYYAPNQVYKSDETWLTKDGTKVIESIGKIGKRYKNGVPPEEISEQFSIDGLRLYMMYLGPLEQNKPWEYSAIKGMTRFLDKILKIEITESVHEDIEYDFHQMLKKVKHDSQELKFNTAIAAIIIFINKYQNLPKDLYEKLLIILAPFAPHLAEYLFAQHEFAVDSSIFDQKWPQTKDIKKNIAKLNIVFTINGKKRAMQEFAYDIDDASLEKFAKELAADTKKIIIIRDNNNRPKLVNIVV